MSLTLDDIAAINKWASGHADIAQVWLYGSMARGDAHAGSDIDLGIVMVGRDADERFARWPDHPDTWAAELRLSRPVQLEWYDPEACMDRVGPGVRRDGVLLYQRSTF